MNGISRTKKPPTLASTLAAVTTVALALAAFSTGANGQPPPGWREAGRARLDPRQQATRGFEATAPAIGEQMPDLVVYDADGEGRRLRELLQGHYTIIVLGCLT